MNIFSVGQRWMSDGEPELGLGTISETDDRLVQIMFPASSEVRCYAVESAPLRRIIYKVGDQIEDNQGRSSKVISIDKSLEILRYKCIHFEISETQLSDAIKFSSADERLLNGMVDDVRTYHLRTEALQHRCGSAASDIRGFVGPKLDLFPHQLYVAHEVSSRVKPRVLLSDEVGLGKTIEAGLIIHRLLLAEKAKRILILLPESLVHQWFVEMLRKFNLWFSIVDKKRCEATQQGENPFADESLVLAPISLFHENKQIQQQAFEATWDVLIVDEAHHLTWSDEVVNEEYQFIERLSSETPGVLLLTATPNQLGQKSHFARLRLLDPERFYSYKEYSQSAVHFQEVAQVAKKILDDQQLSPNEQRSLQEHFSDDQALIEDLSLWQAGERKHKDKLLEELIDRHGPGRLLFRNTRAVMKNFPKRRLHSYSLKNDFSSQKIEASTAKGLIEGIDKLSIAKGFSADPRLLILLNFLKENLQEKVLLICTSQEKVLAIEEAVRQHSSVLTSVFHEGLSLIQRDKNAVYFAKNEGARLLICSEIGSEGRNFQFAHHLFLFDLPVNPGLLEQRIGRLDRIGQTTDINIHVPYLAGTAQETLFRWYNEGLNAFEKALSGYELIVKQFSNTLTEAFQGKTDLNKLIKDTAKSYAEIQKQMEQGRDQLLELNSFRPKASKHLLKAIEKQDNQRELIEFTDLIFDCYGINSEEVEPHIYQIKAGPNMFTDAFPSLPTEGMMATYRRQSSLQRDDVSYLSWDHPMITGGIDLLLASEKGNSSFAIYEDPDARSIILETYFILETASDYQLALSSHLPPSPIRILINHKLEDLSSGSNYDSLHLKLKNDAPHKLLDVSAVAQEILPQMMQESRRLAELKKQTILETLLESSEEKFSLELQRLEELRVKNPLVSDDEINELSLRQEKTLQAMRKAQLRQDSICLIWRGPKTYFA